MMHEMFMHQNARSPVPTLQKGTEMAWAALFRRGGSDS